MPFVLLLLLMLACLPVQWPEPPAWLGFYGSMLLTMTAMGSVVLAAAALAQLTRRGLYLRPQRRPIYLQRYTTGRFYHSMAMIVVFGFVLYLFGWGWVVQEVCTVSGGQGEALNWTLPGAELLILAPFLIALILSWTFFYDAERTIHETAPIFGEATPHWTRAAYVGFHVRNNLALVFAPIALLILAASILHIWPTLGDDWRFQVIAFILLAAVFAGMPWVFRLVLGLKPMPNGPLRQRLLRTAERLHFRFSNILIWNTHSGVANAMVVGILPWLRYVILTDRLAEELTAGELEAVFGHEVGHIKHRHMQFYLGFIIASIFVVSELSKALNLDQLLNLTTRQDLAVLPRLALQGGYIFVVFGFLSRRCEGQADIYGCRAVSCQKPNCYGHSDEQALAPAGNGLCQTGICTFIDALEKVAYLNGISRDKPGWLQSWRHSTIARRVEFLERILSDPTVEPRFQRTVFVTKSALLMLLLLVLYALGHSQGWGGLLSL